MPALHLQPALRRLPQLLCAACAACAAALLVHAPSARSQTVSTLPPASAEPAAPMPTPSERLQALVPARVGNWTRAALKGGRPGPDGVTKPVAEAEFRRAESRAWMMVAHSAMPIPALGEPTERRGSEGSERFYAEGTSAVRETVRAADGRVDVALMRADGVVVTLWGLNVTSAELKALALAVAPLPPR
jgi:hypothetical protein